MFKIKLGAKVKCLVTGFTGIVTSQIIYLNGCRQYGILAPAEKGVIKDAQWIDEGRLQVLKGGIQANQKNPGGPMGHDTPTSSNYRG